jgi:hypothetical protein
MGINMDSEQLEIVELGIELAFEAGTWVGQVQLEEHFDREQFSSAMLESVLSKKTAMPIQEASSGRTVQINLRSDEWRKGVRRSAAKYKHNAIEFIKDNLL